MDPIYVQMNFNDCYFFVYLRFNVKYLSKFLLISFFTDFNQDEELNKKNSDDSKHASYFVRHLASKFLLSGKETSLKPDKDVKVFVKAIALECVTNTVLFLPEVLCIKINESKETHENVQYLYEILNYIDHSDDKMKINTCALIGNFITAVLLKSDGTYEKWLFQTSKQYHVPG